jgi:hypothetical protein
LVYVLEHLGLRSGLLISEIEHIVDGVWTEVCTPASPFLGRNAMKLFQLKDMISTKGDATEFETVRCIAMGRPMMDLIDSAVASYRPSLLPLFEWSPMVGFI